MDNSNWGKHIFTIIFLLPLGIYAQDTLKLSRKQSESIFLKENLSLIAEQLEIPQAEAMVMQASLWPNPSFEINEVNLWATQGQLSVFGDELQGFNGGTFGKNQQIGLSIEQLILTAGKRRKLMALEQVTVDKSKEYFQDLLRNLKLEFRHQLTHLQFLQLKRGIYQNQLSPIKQLTGAFQKQVEQGFVPRGEYVRLKALELEIAKNINELNSGINEAQKDLKTLMHLPSTTVLEITPQGYAKNTEQFQTLVLHNLISLARDQHPEIQISRLDENYFKRLHAYEKAQSTPDLTLQANYDRGGNFMYNFVGFGLSLDLPFFNRNQGRIRKAQIEIDQTSIRHRQVEAAVENEIVLAYQNLFNAIDFLQQIEPDYETTLDELLAAYTKNFENRDIGLLEYLDFFDAYLENRKIILEATKEVNEKAEDLNYAIGQDLIN